MGQGHNVTGTQRGPPLARDKESVAAGTIDHDSKLTIQPASGHGENSNGKAENVICAQHACTYAVNIKKKLL